MPAIKLKKVTAEYLAEKEKENEKIKLSKAKQLADEEEEEDESDSEVENKKDEKPHNFLDVKVLWEKRKRTIPVDEQKLVDWLDSNLEKKEDVYLPGQQLYEFYCAMCQAQGQETKVVDIPVFNKYIREKYGKFFGFQETSPYKVLLKERKAKAKKSKDHGDIPQVKIRDIVTEVINDAGNPRVGVRFFQVSKAIMRKYPAQRVDIYPKRLKWALERGVAVGYLERVRGVGMCGLYRVTGEPTKEELEREKKKKMALQVKDEPEKEVTEDKEGDGEAKLEKTNGSEEEEEEEKKSEEDGEASDPTPKKQKPKKKKKISKTVVITAERHSDPKSVEDALPMAITYQSEPKEASGIKIKKYIDRFYHTDINSDRLKKALDTGVDRGLWEKLSGNGIQGIYHLLTDTFMPSSSDDIYDQIAQAIVAYNEPKQASSVLIKKYISQYHPKLNVDNRPKNYRNCLQRAVDKRILRQLSGIGASGTFQLLQQFIPSPAILAGESDDEEEDEDVHADEVDDVKPEYIPRKTKHGRLAIRVKSQPSAANATGNSRKARQPASRQQQRKASANRKVAGKRKKIVEASDDDEDEEEEEKPKPKAAKNRGKNANKTAKKSTTKKAATPAKSSSKKKPSSQKKSASKKSVGKSKNGSATIPAARTPSQSRKREKLSYTEESDAEENDEIVKVGGVNVEVKETSKGRKRGKVSYEEHPEEDEEEERQEVQTPSKKQKGRKSREASPPPSESRKRGRVNYTEQSDEEEEIVPKKATPSKKSTKRKLDDDEYENDREPAASPAKKKAGAESASTPSKKSKHSKR